MKKLKDKMVLICVFAISIIPLVLFQCSFVCLFCLYYYSEIVE